jgi:hypothetical protein
MAFATAGAAVAQPLPAGVDSQIASIAAGSSCAARNWRDRGRAPVGYIKGMALVYAKSYCELRRGTGTAVAVMAQPLGGAGSDALAWYGLPGGTAIDRLRGVYNLAIGLGMRESSGNTTEGRDTTVAHPTAANAEAGLFQTSFDSFGKSPLFPGLFSEYAAAPAACRLATFRQGARDLRRPLVGSGPGADYQRSIKECPALAAEYVMIMLRIDRAHFGPINRQEAEFSTACEAMLKRVEAASGC